MMRMAIVNISCQELRHFDLLLFKIREKQVNKPGTVWCITFE